MEAALALPEAQAFKLSRSLTSLNGTSFTPLPGGPNTFAKVPGSASLLPEIFTFAPVLARDVRFAVGSNYGDVIETGFAEVAFNAVIQDLSLALDMREINLGVFETATRDVNSRLFRLRARGTEGELANIGLAAAYSSQGMELVSLGIDGKQAVNFKQTTPAAKRFEVFAQGDFSATDRETSAAAAGFGGWTEAGTAGIEYSLTDRLTAGFAIGYVHNNTDIASGAGSIDIDGVAASLYASWFKNNFYVDGLYSFSYLENDLRRTIPTGVATAKPASYGNTLALNTGYNIIYPGIVAGPIASLKYTHGEIDGYTESAGTAVQSQGYDSLISELGWQASFPRTIHCCKLTRLTPQLHGAWAHQYEQGRVCKHAISRIHGDWENPGADLGLRCARRGSYGRVRRKLLRHAGLSG